MAGARSHALTYVDARSDFESFDNRTLTNVCVIAHNHGEKLLSESEILR